MSWDLFLDDAENETSIGNNLSMPVFPAPFNDRNVDNKFNSKNSYLVNENFYNNQKSYSSEDITSNTFSNPSGFENDSSILNDLNSTLNQSSISPYVKVQFHPNRTQIALNSNKINIAVGDYVATEADRGYDIGQVVGTFDDNEEISNSANYQIIIRKAKPQEVLFLHEKRQKEENAIKICQEKANELKLPMTITSTEYQFDGKKLNVYFTAKTYVDFRKLVNSLFKVFGIRIWMVWYDGKAPVRDVFTHNKQQNRGDHWK